MEPLIREAVLGDADGLAHAIITATNHAFRGIVPERCLAFTEKESSENWRRTLNDGFRVGEFLCVAEERPGSVIGYVLGGPSRRDPVRLGEMKQLMVLPAKQRRGLGRLLVAYVARRLAARGIHRIRVEVLKCNPNRAFYERLGAEYISEHPHDWGGVMLPMCVYEWKDTRALFEGHGTVAEKGE
jgi:ribosomal protein S18 acetylase RimI-like enzyme